MKKATLLLIFIVLSITVSWAQNPLIMDEFTADPSARVFNDKVYVYPSHDIRLDSGRFANWFCMEDYHVYSSENLTQWEDHGVILSQYDVSWVDPSTYSMWAPDCIEKNGKYYFYFPSTAKDKSEGRGRRVGVAVADSPEGPFIPQEQPMKDVFGIDPNPFIDRDGQAYLYWGGGEKLYMAKLKENMLELATEPQEVVDLPAKFKEGPYLFERNGKYYFTFPHVPETTERLVYAMGDSPMGPFEFKGVIMKESPVECWTNHHSIIEYRDQWYLFYHHNDLSPDFDKNRSIKADSLFFNADGTIQEVLPTLRGVGITPASARIQTDRYSLAEGENVSYEFVDDTDPHQGWQVHLPEEGNWISYNKVDFGTGEFEELIVKGYAEKGGDFEIRLNAPDGPRLTDVEFDNAGDYQLKKVTLSDLPKGIHDLYIFNAGDSELVLDWIQFK
ncbi:carbohydrate binding protein with CBM6 domain [Marinilabilia salmonicolor]|jgi:hypothetical protein|uniref:family 43 glycosylhydrolase n=1 Tax=Marinilabilia salmonicolor TaxID=989 RepID=UPI000D06AD47|nr:family 43 glycosylhydrolase [Marinilabilia salmonicolor]PRY96639.1 carbohydrate binding protein with CBM6 domain [Marinilabilia salmonicolor]